LTILEMARELIRSRHPGQANFAFEELPLDDERAPFVDANGFRLFAFGWTRCATVPAAAPADPSRFRERVGSKSACTG
ncbi:MAG: hypothetical protein NTY84_01575, partial [Verrucomicrobia bacterium]|nr:hypothetical protein [Verrucomicrobiota bacterium]